MNLSYCFGWKWLIWWVIARVGHGDFYRRAVYEYTPTYIHLHFNENIFHPHLGQHIIHHLSHLFMSVYRSVKSGTLLSSCHCHAFILYIYLRSDKRSQHLQFLCTEVVFFVYLELWSGASQFILIKNNENLVHQELHNQQQRACAVTFLLFLHIQQCIYLHVCMCVSVEIWACWTLLNQSKFSKARAVIKVHELFNGPSIVSYAKHAFVRLLLNCATCFKFSAKLLPHFYIYTYICTRSTQYDNILTLYFCQISQWTGNCMLH